MELQLQCHSFQGRFRVDFLYDRLVGSSFCPRALLTEKHMSTSSASDPASWGSTHTSIQLSLVAQSCLTLCSPMGCNTPGFPVHHHLWELAQTHVRHRQVQKRGIFSNLKGDFLPKEVQDWDHLYLRRKRYFATAGELLFSRSIMSDYLWTHGRQHTRLPCRFPSMEVTLPRKRPHNNKCSHWWKTAINDGVGTDILLWEGMWMLPWRAMRTNVYWKDCMVGCLLSTGLP